MSTPVNTATIPAGKSTTNLFALPGTNFQLTSFLIPTGFDNGTGKGIVVLGSYDGVNTFPIWSGASGAYVAFTNAQAFPGSIIAMRFDDMPGIPYIALQSGTISAGTITAANQTNAATFTLQFRAFQ